MIYPDRDDNRKYFIITLNRSILFLALISLLLIQGCVGYRTFPTVARAGDTVSLMAGGSEIAPKRYTTIILTDANNQQWDLRSLGLFRSLFNLRADGRAHGQHYSPYLDTFLPWSNGHEPVQTVLVTDLPNGLPVGPATITVNTSVTDDSSGIALPFTALLDIIAGVGTKNKFPRRDALQGAVPVDFRRLEPAPYAKVSFGNIPDKIGAVSLIIDFDETVLNPNDINIYAPESAVRGSFSDPGAFGATQRMIYWRQDGQQLYIDIVAPQGIEARYLQFDVIHPRGLPGTPKFNLLSQLVYDVNGNIINVLPNMVYFP